MFKIINRVLRVRKLRTFATGCNKLFTDTRPRKDILNDSKNIYVTEFIPMLIMAGDCSKQLCKGFCGPIVGGGWTNGFVILFVRDKYKRDTKGIFNFPDIDKLKTPVHRVNRCCMIFYKELARYPLIALQADGITRIFDSRFFDVLISLYGDIVEDLELYFDALNSGVIVKYLDLSLAYLARYSLPIDSLLIAQAEKYYANLQDSGN